VRPGHPHQPVAEVATAIADAHHLGVCAERVRGFSVALPDLRLNLLVVPQRLTGEAVHTGHQFAKIAGDHEIGTAVHERLDRCGLLSSRLFSSSLSIPVGDVGVLLPPRQGELPLDDLAGHDEPGMVVPGDVRHGAQQQPTHPSLIEEFRNGSYRAFTT
jgi:hypothetical protein